MNALSTLPRLLFFTALLSAALLPSPVAAADRRPGFVDTVLSWFTGETPDSSRNSTAWADILSTLETARLKADDALRQSTALAEAGRVFPVEHNAVLTAYGERRLAVNGLIERMKAHLITGGSDAPALLAKVRTELARLSENDLALAQTRDAKHPIVAGLVATAVGSAIEGLISEAVESWVSMKLEQKRLLIGQLDGKKWAAAPARPADILGR